MKKFLIVFLTFLSIAGAGQAAIASMPEMEVYFSPRGGCTAAVVKELSRARREVLVQAYSFTSAPIAKALIDAHMRGVKVSILLDKSQRTERYSSLTFFTNAGIDVKIDDVHAIAHNKVMVIHGNRELAGKYIENFYEHRQHSH